LTPKNPLNTLEAMPLHKLTDSELRDHGKRSIEALEMWLRRLIDTELSSSYGANYLLATMNDEGNLISRSITKEMVARRIEEPARYPRAIDAALLNDVINIICKPGLFDHFRGALNIAFPLGDMQAKTTLEKLVAPRNALYHANPVSVRQIEQVICYSNDAIASIKRYYESKNLSEQFNAPTIIRISDSLGNVFHSPQLADLGSVGRGALRAGSKTVATLRAGETLSLEIEVDPSFARSEYLIQWFAPNLPIITNNSEKFVLALQSKHVSKMFQIQVRLISKADWHRYQTFDDSVAIAYCVLPPP
jgi:hypothetical protein